MISAYWAYQFYSKDLPIEQLTAFLSLLPFESFLEEGDRIIAYLPEEDLKLLDETQFRKYIPGNFGFKKFRIEPKNWNEEWEQNFNPIRVGDFCYIRASFHSPSSGHKIQIVINPNLAFGTGHHETTFMMIRMMKELDFHGKCVIDAGCGTGILSILSEKLGAQKIFALDNDSNAIENSKENLKLNNCRKIEVHHISIAEIAQFRADVILVNINLNALLMNLSGFYNALSPNGFLLISGILITDKRPFENVYSKFGFISVDLQTKGDWICILIRKPKV